MECARSGSLPIKGQKRQRGLLENSAAVQEVQVEDIHGQIQNTPDLVIGSDFDDLAKAAHSQYFYTEQ